MAQLTLFEGSHLPRSAAREALCRGDLCEAGAQLLRLGADTEEAADASRLERIAARLAGGRGASAETVHEAFASALAGDGRRGFLSDAEWFGLYAQLVADALEAEPGLRFRGWLGAHFAFAAGDLDAARRGLLRIVETAAPGPAWIAAARLAFALGEAPKAREWLHAACLGGSLAPADLEAEPALERCGVAALDAAPALPPLPGAVEDVCDAARALGLPGPWTRWVAVIGEIDRVLAPAGGGAAGPDATSAADDDPPRAFLAALRAARRSRERDARPTAERCSDRELRARRRMQRIAPPLLARYLEALRRSLL